jgi:hypothetical protein
VNSACAGDEALRREVEALLGSHERASTFIETSPASIATRIIETGQSDLLLGQTFGHYKISKRIARALKILWRLYFPDISRMTSAQNFLHCQAVQFFQRQTLIRTAPRIRLPLFRNSDASYRNN